MGAPRDPVATVVHAVLPRRESFIKDLTARTEEEIAVLDHDERLRELLEASIAENVVTALHFLGHGTDPSTVDAPPSAVSYARRLALRDVPLSALLRAYRMGQAQFLNLCLEEAARLHRADSSPTMIALVDTVSTMVDRVCEQVAHAYEEERERWASSRGVLRQYWVTQLLHGPSPDIKQAETALGYRIDDTHLAVEVWIDRPISSDAAVDVFDRTGSVLRTVFRSSHGPLQVPTDERNMRLWFQVPADLVVDSDPVREGVEQANLPVRVAIGRARAGLEGFRSSARAAERAKALALSAGAAAPRVLAFAQVAPVALMVDEPQELADFVADTLGELAADDARRESLRDTLRVFLAMNGSYASTADQLGVHRNTVHYRVQQAMEKFGISPEHNAFELQLALHVCRWHGEKVLRPPPGSL